MSRLAVVGRARGRRLARRSGATTLGLGGVAHPIQLVDQVAGQGDAWASSSVRYSPRPVTLACTALPSSSSVASSPMAALTSGGPPGRCGAALDQHDIVG